MISFVNGPTVVEKLTQGAIILGAFLFAVGVVGYIAATIEGKIRAWREERYIRDIARELGEEEQRDKSSTQLPG